MEINHYIAQIAGPHLFSISDFLVICLEKFFFLIDSIIGYNYASKENGENEYKKKLKQKTGLKESSGRLKVGRNSVCQQDNPESGIN